MSNKVDLGKNPLGRDRGKCDEMKDLLLRQEVEHF